MKEYKCYQNTHGHYTVSLEITTSTISGGPVIGYFYNKKDAEDFCFYKNNTLSKPLIIEKGDFKNIKTNNTDELN